jgi:general secretion pathway protein K
MALIPKDEKGMALILTITLIGLIVVMVLQFSKSIRTGLHETTSFSDGVKLGVIAKSGFNCALAVLCADDNDSDSFHDQWASLSQYSSESASLFDNDGRFQVEVTDLAGKIQINRLINLTGEKKGDYNQAQYDMLTMLLSNTPFNMEQNNIKDILDAIKDWIDEDNDTYEFGAENSYYRTLDHPYSCRNAPIESLDELLLVKGITPELFYGTNEAPGLSNYLTTAMGDGRININTADPVVLGALSEDFDNDMVEDMVTFRNNEENLSSLSNPKWYKDATSRSEDFIPQSLITTKSSYFQIRSSGIKDSRSKETIGTIKRDGKNLTVLSWKML